MLPPPRRPGRPGKIGRSQPHALPAGGQPLLWLVLLVIGILLLFSLFSRPLDTPIHRILEDPRAFDGQMVSVRGEVQEASGFSGFRFFSVTDSTGTIMVLTDRSVPRIGSVVRARGFVEQLVAGEDEGITVLVEPGAN